MSMFSTHSSRRAAARHGGLERVQVDHEQVDRPDGVGQHGGLVARVLADGEQPAVHQRVQRLQPAVHHLGEAGEVRDLGDGQAGRRQRVARAAGRHQGHAAPVQEPREVDEARLVRDREQSAFDAAQIACHSVVFPRVRCERSGRFDAAAGAGVVPRAAVRAGRGRAALTTPRRPRRRPPATASQATAGISRADAAARGTTICSVRRGPSAWAKKMLSSIATRRPPASNSQREPSGQATSTAAPRRAGTARAPGWRWKRIAKARDAGRAPGTGSRRSSPDRRSPSGDSASRRAVQVAGRGRVAVVRQRHGRVAARVGLGDLGRDGAGAGVEHAAQRARPREARRRAVAQHQRRMGRGGARRVARQRPGLRRPGPAPRS